MTIPGSIEEITAVVKGETIPRRFLDTVSEHADLVALRWRQDGGFGEWTYADYAERVARFAADLQARGIRPGDRVLLMLRNRPEFHVVDLAAQFLRAVPVSIYNSSSVDEIAYLGRHCRARLAVVDEVFRERFDAARPQLPDLTDVLVVTGVEPDGFEPLRAGGAGADLRELAEATTPEDVATLIYTSGTTGPPKAVVITQFNVVYTVEALRRAFDYPDLPGLRLISYLPMAHIAERIVSHYCALVFGFTITTCPELTEIADYAREVHPHILVGVPRVWEKIHARVNAVLAGDPERQQKFNEAIEAAIPIRERMTFGQATKEDQELWDFLDAVAFKQVRDLLSFDEVRLAVSAAAPLRRDVFEWFRAIGLPLTECYGLSEVTGPMTMSVERPKAGTVGPAIPGCEVRIAPDGEVLCRGGHVFAGYLDDPERTSEVLVDGWLHTGDIGSLDADGYLTIIDRKKELIITSGGKNVSPANLETALTSIPLVGQACVVGDNRPYVAALLVLDPEVAPVWAANHGIDGTLPELATHPAVLEEVQRGVDKVNEHFARSEQVRRFLLLGEEWQPDSDVLTPTQKLKRRGVMERYAKEIESLYA